MGASRYFDAHPQFREPLARIYVGIQPQGAELSHLALLDTGGHYCLLNADFADEIQDRLTEGIGSAKLRTGHGILHGDLYVHTVALVADLGRSLEIESTVFVSPDWRGPSILGYTGALERSRFALDPRTNLFYFGPLL